MLIPIAAVAGTCLVGIFIYYYLVQRGKGLPWAAWPHGAEEPRRVHGGSSAESRAAPLGTVLGHGCPSPMPYWVSMAGMLCPDCHLLCPSFHPDPKQQMQKQVSPELCSNSGLGSLLGTARGVPAAELGLCLCRARSTLRCCWQTQRWGTLTG